MARDFDVPFHFRSAVISTVKHARFQSDPRKRDLSPSVLDFGPIRFKLARHFGFCYGVENAIEIAYRALEEQPGKRVFLLSEMIHNQRVNNDLRRRGVAFLRSTDGKQLIPFDTLTPDDVVIVPAFGASVEISAQLSSLGLDLLQYDTTCPFVTKVWRRSEQIGSKGYTVVIHGKRYHEETRATLSRARQAAPAVVVRDLEEAQTLAGFIRGILPVSEFAVRFPDRYSAGFDPDRDLVRIGVVNQTTMLAAETREIAQLLRQAMIERYGEQEIDVHFADTSDTLCYATNENQTATHALVESGGDLAIVVGGYNSSNTSHLVELCERWMPTYFVSGASELLSPRLIRHFDYPNKRQLESPDWLSLRGEDPAEIVLTAGASCPDSIMEEVMFKIVSWFPECRPVEDVLAPFQESSLS